MCAIIDLCPSSRRWRGMACAMSVVVATLFSPPVIAQDDSLSGPAWDFADQAYKAYASKEYQRAVTAAREAVALRPDLLRLRILLINSLAAAGDSTGAIAAADEAIAAGLVNDELRSIRDRLNAQIVPGTAATAPTDAAYQAADAGYKEFAKRDFAAAIVSARRAVALDPGKAAYWLLLMNALAAANRVAEAEIVANKALDRAPDDVNLRLQRGYLRQRLGRFGPAMDDLSWALKQSGLTASQKRSARLALADAALAAKNPKRALDALSPLAGERSYDVAARRGFALQALDRQAEALDAFRSALFKTRIPSERVAMVRGEISALVALGRKDEAKERFVAARSSNDLSGLKNLDMAYLASQVGDDEVAADYFSRADRDGQLNGQALLDAAYVAKRRFDNKTAESLFKRAIDAQSNGELALTPQRLLEVRRDVTNVERTWGAYASLLYSPIGFPASGLPGPAPGGKTLQAGAEIYWRPPDIGYRNGATFELFARAFETLYSKPVGAVGEDTIQGSAGARWKPFSEQNLVFEVSRLVPIGKVSRWDWLLRAAYSKAEGGDLRLDTTHWTYWQVYGELDRFTAVQQTLANAELRAGHSFRLPGFDDKIVFTPFAVVGAAYDSLLPRPDAFGAGAGANLRFWFRQDQYSGPASYLDLTAQYRFKLAGDDRAAGWFAGVSVSY